MYIYITSNKKSIIMRKDLFTINKTKILEFTKKTKFYSAKELQLLLKDLKTRKFVSQTFTFKKLVIELSAEGMKQETVFLEHTSTHKSITRYYFDDNINIFEKALAFNKGSFLSMSSSLVFQGLCLTEDKFIYISKEDVDKKNYSDNKLIQENIDKAFKRPYRRTSAYAEFENKYIVLLTPKNSKNAGVVTYQGIKVSSIDRALIEMIVNIQYFESSKSIIEIFKPIKKSISIEEVFDILNSFSFIYPYFQSLGFFLERIGFKREELANFSEQISEFNFYTEKQKNSYKYDNFWKIYY